MFLQKSQNDFVINSMDAEISFYVFLNFLYFQYDFDAKMHTNYSIYNIKHFLFKEIII